MKNSDNNIDIITDSVEVMPVQVELAQSRRKVVNKYMVAASLVALLILLLFLLLPAQQLMSLQTVLLSNNKLFFWMLLVGFFAELVAGSMGMGYGVICTTTLLILNMPPPVISASIHSAEAFTSAAGTISHWQLGNINKKLVKALAVPAIFGAILGAILLSFVGENYAKITKPIIAIYSLYLGIRILQNAFKSTHNKNKKPKVRITALGFIGGFIDSFGGGGWGPLVTGTFIKNGRTPRFVIGSSTFAKCVLTVASAITFIFTIGIQHWNIVAGLLIGGIITAPFSAMLTAKLPVKKMFIVVGIVVIICSLITIIRSLFL